MLKLETHYSSNFIHKVQSNKLTHLSIADDLMIFVATGLVSINLIKDALDVFKMISGLSVNQSKSEVFFAAVPSTLQSQILSILNFRDSSLPVRYLGMPLISSKLTFQDCVPLIEKITARIRTWTARQLSFSGRLQIIQSVLNSIQMYWSSILTLPKKVVKVIEQKFNRFLRKGQDEGRGEVKVAWTKFVCLKKRRVWV